MRCLTIFKAIGFGQPNESIYESIISSVNPIRFTINSAEKKKSEFVNEQDGSNFISENIFETKKKNCVPFLTKTIKSDPSDQFHSAQFNTRLGTIAKVSFLS